MSVSSHWPMRKSPIHSECRWLVTMHAGTYRDIFQSVQPFCMQGRRRQRTPWSCTCMTARSTRSTACQASSEAMLLSLTSYSYVHRQAPTDLAQSLLVHLLHTASYAGITASLQARHSLDVTCCGAARASSTAQGGRRWLPAWRSWLGRLRPACRSAPCPIHLANTDGAEQLWSLTYSQGVRLKVNPQLESRCAAGSEPCSMNTRRQADEVCTCSLWHRIVTTPMPYSECI